MKRIILLLFLCFSATINAQKNKIIKTNPLGFLLNVYSIGYEQEVTPNQSFNINASYADFSNNDFKIKGPGISISYRFYIQEISLFGSINSGDPFEGFFIGPSATYSSLEFNVDGNESSFMNESSIKINGVEIDTNESNGNINTSNFNMGGVLGYQWNWNPITLELYLGAGLTKINYEDDFSFSGTEFGFGLSNVGFSIGYSF